MIEFWLIAAAMVTLVVAAVLIPLWRDRQQTAADGERYRDRVNTGLFQERLTELDQDLAEGKIDPEQYQGLRAELERTLLDDIPEKAASSGRGGSGRVLASGVALLIVGLAGSYYYWGIYRGPVETWQQTQDRLSSTVQQALLDPGSLSQAAQKDLPNFTRVLQARVLREDERDPNSLFLLGVALLQLQAPQAAQGVLKRAHELAPQRTDVQLAYAYADIMANKGKLSKASETLLHNVLKADPHQQKALMLLGFGAFNSGQYRLAIDSWQQLVALLPKGSKSAGLLEKTIDQARQRLASATDVDQQNKSGATTAGGPHIDVTVKLDPKLRAKVAPHATLFIYAKAAKGPPMPLAAVRRKAADFPVSVVLDDSKAMLPALKLSNYHRVVVSARISKSGGALPKPGDLEATSRALTLTDGSQSVALTVSRIVQ